MAPEAERPPLPEGLVAFVKRDCPTCGLVVPILRVYICIENNKKIPAKAIEFLFSNMKYSL